MAQKEVSWRGQQFSMQNVHPTTAKNPVTQALNVVLDEDGSVKRRKSFTSGAGETPQNHIVCELNGQSFLILKTSGGFSVLGGGPISMSATDPPIDSGNPSSTESGSFALFGNEVYYCDSKTGWAWDGVNPARRPGVVGLQGKTYNGDGAPNPLGLGYGTDQIPGITDPGGSINFSDDEHQTIGGDRRWPNSDPGIEIQPPISGNVVGTLARGEKTLNAAFALGYYDPKRRIFGRRSEMFAYPYIFGPQGATNAFLTDLQCQYVKVFQTCSTPTGHPEYLIAIWFSPGQQIASNPTSYNPIPGLPLIADAVPTMSKRMTQLCFLEAIVAPDLAEYRAVKDNATLAISGRYIDAYERPVPAKFMMILNNGTAIYFYPWINPPEAGGSSAVLGNHALYSVNHPEQIGLNTQNQRDTISLLPNLKGIPRRVVSDGDTQLLLTSQGLYQVGFNGGVMLNEVVAGRGLRGTNSLATSAIGTVWYADDGVCWLRGGQVTLLDRKLGFSSWFDEMSPGQKEAVVIGLADTAGQILMFLDRPAGKRALCYDYQRQFISEFSEVGAPNYAVFFRSDVQSKLYVFGTGIYPGKSYAGGESSLTIWMNEDILSAKTLQDVVLDLGPRGGAVSVYVEVHQAGETTEGNEQYSASDTDTILATGNGAGRFVSARFHGMRGRLFKIKITGPSGAWSLAALTVHYNTDEDGDARSV